MIRRYEGSALSHAPSANATPSGPRLGEHDLAHVALEAGAVDSAETEGVRLATMHRVKGLEFDRVVMASMNADLVPLPAAIGARGDAVERESAETEERALVYVARDPRQEGAAGAELRYSEPPAVA